MTGIALPWKTTTSGLSVFDTESPYRPIAWLDAAPDVSMLYKQNDAVLLKILDQMPSFDQEMGNPVVRWIEDSRTEVGTTFNTAAVSTDTYIDLVDPYIVSKRSSITVPETGENMEVVDVDYDKSEGWTGESAANTANVRVTRGKGGTVATTTTTTYHAVAGPPLLAEQSDVPVGTGYVPTTNMYNFVSILGQTVKMTKMQEQAVMQGEWGTLPKVMIDHAFQLRQKMAVSLLFEPRRTEATTNEGQLYISGGVIHFLKDNFLDLGAYTSNASWQSLNDLVEATYLPSASSGRKVWLAGQNQFGMLLRFMRDRNRIGSDEPYFEQGFGAQTFTLKTDLGYTLPVVQDRWGLSANLGLQDWGFVLDMGNMEGRKYKGFGFQWVQHIEARASVLQREDAYIGSYCLVLKHQATHAVVRGGTYGIVNR